MIVHSLQVMDWQPGEYPELSLDVACGAGTYIRSIARDLGTAVGTGATLAGLQRTKSSGFTLEESVSLEDLAQQLEDETFTPLLPDTALTVLPEVRLGVAEAVYWCQGRKPLLETDDPSLGPDNIVRVVGLEKNFLGIGEIRANDSGTILGHRVVYVQPHHN